MAFQAQETHSDADERPFIKQYKLFHASFAQFCYTGAQVAIASFFINYATQTRPNTSNAVGAQLFAGAQAAFAVGRFFGVFIMRYVRPRLIFLGFMTSCIIFLIPAIAIPTAIKEGNAGISMLYMVLFFESICFPTIVALGMRGLGRHTKRGSGYIIGGVVGGACVPPLTGVASDRHGNGIGMVVPLCFFCAAWTYSYAVNFIADYVKVVDALGETNIGIQGHTIDVDEENAKRQSVEEKAAVVHHS